MKQLLGMITAVVIIVVLVVLGFTLKQVNERQAELTEDLQIRTALLADNLKESIRGPLLNNETSELKRLISKFETRDRLLGLAVYNNDGRLLSASTDLSDMLTENQDFPREVMDSDSARGELLTSDGDKVYIFATPLHKDEKVIGSLVVFQKASYIDTTMSQVWRTNFLRLLVQALLFSVAVVLILRLIIYKPIIELAESIRKARGGNNIDNTTVIKSHSFFHPITTEISKMSKSLVQARTSASEEARLRIEKLDSPWTAERLREFVRMHLKEYQIFVVSNREPYIHTRKRNKVECIVPASGMVTALEPLMEACGGTWLAHGSGDADRTVVDSANKVAVPLDDPKYQLKRLWLTEDEVRGYYQGFSNEAMWPLCQMAHVPLIFRKEDWVEYRKVNGKFAHSLLSEIKAVQKPLVLIQDYHLALLPRMIKKSRPDAVVGIFWHIPWPNAEAFSVCPWSKEILEGMLGADVLGFHTQQHCNNFVDTVNGEIEALTDLETFAITRKGHTAYVKPFPIGVAFENGEDAVLEKESKILEKTGIQTKYLGLGVDRMDYTKGILEKLRGIEFFFDLYPLYKGKFTFLQVASPTREEVEKYRQFSQEVIKEAKRINKKLQDGMWRPIILLNEHHTHEEIYSLYRAANVCLVTSLSDGMNLVAKEFVAARGDEAGVLILSEFTGSARTLKGALIINPYSAEETAVSIHEALTMPLAQQRSRLKKMRESVQDHNIYRWAAEYLKSVTSLGQK